MVHCSGLILMRTDKMALSVKVEKKMNRVEEGCRLRCIHGLSMKDVFWEFLPSGFS
jgi:hypothetical protein